MPHKKVVFFHLRYSYDANKYVEKAEVLNVTDLNRGSACYCQRNKIETFHFFVACAHTFYGANCTQQCDTACKNHECDYETGECFAIKQVLHWMIFTITVTKEIVNKIKCKQAFHLNKCTYLLNLLPAQILQC